MSDLAKRIAALSQEQKSLPDRPLIVLQEIKAILEQHPAIQDAAVVVREQVSGNPRPVAYLVPDAQCAFAVRQLVRLESEGLLTGQQRYELPNGMLIVHKNKNETDFVYKEIFEEKAYLSHGITLHDGDCIFDVGANIGLFALFMGQIVKKAVIYAFEPLHPIFEVLRINMALYGLNVRLFECGLSNEAKRETFTYYPYVSIISGRFADAMKEREVMKTFLLNAQEESADETALSSQELDDLLKERLVSEQFTCQVKTLSEVMHENDIERIDLLKIDVEKSELDVLAGIQEDDWPKIRQLVVEVHDIDGRLEQITALLERHRYDLTVGQDAMLKDTGLYNVYAVRPRNEWGQTGEKSGPPTRVVMPTWNSPDILVRDIRHFLAEKLPEYMVPATFMLMDALPLTPSGKVDHRLLPIPGRSTA